VGFQPREGHEEESGGHLNAHLVLRPTLPHPDLSDVLEHSGNGPEPAMLLELGRYEGKLVDFLEISGNVTAEKAQELEELIDGHLVEDSHVNLDKLGRYLSGLEEKRSYPLALTQMFIAYHMVAAGETVFKE
jgi:phosphoribulokinase